jgi:SAM-dependent methyltransferase
MQLLDLVHRTLAPQPWAEGEKIPWNDPEFSRRMLHEHLSQAHDAASRRSSVIDRHVAWIHDPVLGGRPAHILDLSCGPGLYTSRLARLGHACTGIDFSPASIRYAREQAAAAGLSCTYVEQDLRAGRYGHGYDLAMLIFGEINVFRRADAAAILRHAREALRPGGVLVLEAHTDAAVRAIGERPRFWYSAHPGLFSDRPHLCLRESFWDAGARVATERYFIVDAASGAVVRHAASVQAYTLDEYAALLTACGFEMPAFHPDLGGAAGDPSGEFVVAVTHRPPIC